MRRYITTPLTGCCDLVVIQDHGRIMIYHGHNEMGVLPLERPRSQRKLGGFSKKKITTPDQIRLWGIADERKSRAKMNRRLTKKVEEDGDCSSVRAQLVRSASSPERPEDEVPVNPKSTQQTKKRIWEDDGLISTKKAVSCVKKKSLFFYSRVLA